MKKAEAQRAYVTYQGHGTVNSEFIPEASESSFSPYTKDSVYSVEFSKSIIETLWLRWLSSLPERCSINVYN